MAHRHVGTFTLGLSLIAIGIIIPVALMNPDNALKIIQLSPLLLVMLGIEVLIYSFFVKRDDSQRLKYDGLSIFLVFIITVVTVAASLLAPIIKNTNEISKEVRAARNTSTHELNKVMNKHDYRGNWNVNVFCDEYYDYFNIVDVADININGEININIEGSISFDQVVDLVYDVLDGFSEPFNRMIVDVNDHNKIYSSNIYLIGELTKDNVRNSISQSNNNVESYNYENPVTTYIDTTDTTETTDTTM